LVGWLVLSVVCLFVWWVGWFLVVCLVGGWVGWFLLVVWWVSWLVGWLVGWSLVVCLCVWWVGGWVDWFLSDVWLVGWFLVFVCLFNGWGGWLVFVGCLDFICWWVG
jgi:hypothetical protein